MFKIGRELGATPAEVRHRVSATQLLRYAKFFEWEQNERTPDLWYLANIAAILECIPYRVWGKMPPEKMSEIKTHLLKFGSAEDAPEQRELTDEEKAEQATIKSKAGWGAVISRALPAGTIPDQSQKKYGARLPPKVARATQQVTQQMRANKGFPPLPDSKRAPKP